MVRLGLGKGSRFYLGWPCPPSSTSTVTASSGRPASDPRPSVPAGLIKESFTRQTVIQWKELQSRIGSCRWHDYSSVNPPDRTSQNTSRLIIKRRLISKRSLPVSASSAECAYRPLPYPPLSRSTGYVCTSAAPPPEAAPATVTDQEMLTHFGETCFSVSYRIHICITNLRISGIGSKMQDSCLIRRVH